MHTIYTGEHIRLRPFASASEAMETGGRAHGRLIPGWGPMWYQQAAINELYEPDGVLGPELVNFAVERLDSGEVAGYEMAHLPPPGKLGSMLGTFINEPHQASGFGIEAKQLMMCFLFENYPLEFVFAVTISNHSKAIGGLERSGMNYMGSLQQEFYNNGYVDMVYYRIDRSQWEMLPVRQVLRRG